MVWMEFKEQAEQDLISCKTLFDVKDYGNSAYLLQQGLEKFTKAYILKFDLFVREPYKFGHLPLIKMWEVLKKELERKQGSFKKDVREFAKKFIEILDLMMQYFIKIKDPKHEDDRWKISVWKNSLGLNPSTSERDMIKQLKNNLECEFLPVVKEAYPLLLNAQNRLITEISSKPQQKKQLEYLLKNVMDTTLDIQLNQTYSANIDLNDIIEKTPLWFEQLEKLIKEILILSPLNEKEKVLQTYFMKILLLAWIFSVREEMIITFPHEEVGRYPNIVKNSREIYKNNAVNLDVLIKRVCNCCKKIEMMIEL